MNTAAQILLSKINPGFTSTISSRISADKAVSDFVDHLVWLKNRHVKKAWQQKYIVDQTFNTIGIVRNDADIMAHCRVHLAVATNQLKKIVIRMKGEASQISEESLKRYGDVLSDYAFDLMPIATHLGRKTDPDYVFMEGMKNRHVMSSEIFRFSKQLARQSTVQTAEHQADHKISQIASVFVLRQALELKFQRLIGVMLYNREFEMPRLDHGFHYNFVLKNPGFFSFKAVEFSLLRRIFSWCNLIVHRAYQPWAWQVDYAHEVCEGFFAPRESEPGTMWSIHNAVEIRDLLTMQRLFVDHVLKLEKIEKDGPWATDFRDPEAMVIS